MSATDEKLLDSITELNRNFNDFRVDITKQIGAINTNLEGFKGRAESQLSVGKWAGGTFVVVALAFASWVGSTIWNGGKIDAAVTMLSEASKAQGDQIGELTRSVASLENAVKTAFPGEKGPVYTTPPPRHDDERDMIQAPPAQKPRQ